MSMHDVLVRLAMIDDDDTAQVIAISLNADVAIRQFTRTDAATWTPADVKRVAAMLAAHAGVMAILPRAAGANAVAAAVAIDQPELNLVS